MKFPLKWIIESISISDKVIPEQQVLHQGNRLHVQTHQKLPE